MKAHPVDVHVGSRLRTRRKMLGLSQEDLGKPVGITFQQVQKYEKGTNRIGSSRLFQFSTLLKVPVGYFFENFNDEQNPLAGNAGFAEDESSLHFRLENKETRNLIDAYYSIDNPQIRQKMLSLIKSLKSETSSNG